MSYLRLTVAAVSDDVRIQSIKMPTVLRIRGHFARRMRAAFSHTSIERMCGRLLREVVRAWPSVERVAIEGVRGMHRPIS